MRLHLSPAWCDADFFQPALSYALSGSHLLPGTCSMNAGSGNGGATCAPDGAASAAMMVAAVSATNARIWKPPLAHPKQVSGSPFRSQEPFPMGPRFSSRDHD